MGARPGAPGTGVSMAQVYLAKHRVGSLVRREVEALQKNWA
ncbi:MAG: hypothetical protein R3F31_09685 [Verrucomicrobiales bacterium]